MSEQPFAAIGDRRPHLSRRAFVSWAGMTAALARPLPAWARAEFRIGLTPVCLTSDLDVTDGIRNYLSQAMSCPVEVVTRQTYEEITALLISGQLDAAWICGYPFVANRPRLELVAVPVWRGEPLYQSYLIVGHDRAPCAGIDDLQSDIHAFSDPNSNSGYLVTAALLAQRHRRPADFFRKTFFTYAHRDVVRAVASGLADSGSVDGYVWEVLAEAEPELTARTRVVSHSKWLGFPPVATAAQKAAAPET